MLVRVESLEDACLCSEMTEAGDRAVQIGCFGGHYMQGFRVRKGADCGVHTPGDCVLRLTVPWGHDQTSSQDEKSLLSGRCFPAVLPACVHDLLVVTLFFPLSPEHAPPAGLVGTVGVSHQLFSKDTQIGHSH